MVRTLGLDHARQVDVRAVHGDGSDQQLLLGRQQGRRCSHQVIKQVDPTRSELALRQESEWDSERTRCADMARYPVMTATRRSTGAVSKHDLLPTARCVRLFCEDGMPLASTGQCASSLPCVCRKCSCQV